MNKWLNDTAERVAHWASFNAKHHVLEGAVWTGGAALVGFIVGLLL